MDYRPRILFLLRRVAALLLLGGSLSIQAEDTPPLLTLTLADTLLLAAEQNLSVVLAVEQNREAGGALKTTRAGLLPEITLQASQVRQERSVAAFGLPEQGEVNINDPIPFDIDYDGLSQEIIRQFDLPTQGQTQIPDPIPLDFDFADSTGAFNFFDAQFRVSVPLLDLAKLDEYRASKQNLSLSETEIAYVREQVMNQAAALFYGVIVQRYLTQALIEKVSLHEDKLEEVRDIFLSGNATALDVKREELALLNAKVEWTKSQKNLDHAVRELTRFLNLDPAIELNIQGDLEQWPVTENNQRVLIDRAFAQRLDVLRQKQSEQIAVFRRNAARKSRYPTLNASGAFGWQGNTAEDTIETWLISAVAKVPVWDFSKRRGIIEVRQSEVEQERIANQNLENQVINEIAHGLEQVAYQEDYLAVMDSTVAYLDESRLLQEDKVNSGVAKRLDLIAAEVDLAQAEYKKIEATYELILAQLSLLYATGDITLLLERDQDTPP